MRWDLFRFWITLFIAVGAVAWLVSGVIGWLADGRWRQ